jgi:DNA-binding XRE family transcriptional regulator
VRKDNLLMLRNISGFSQEEVAEGIGVSRPAYAKWESGATVPDVDKYQRFVQMYGTTIDSLMKTEQTDDGQILLPVPKGKNIWGTVALNERGQIVAPKAARDHFGLSAGQRFVLLSAESEGPALVPAEICEKHLEKAAELSAMCFGQRE